MHHELSVYSFVIPAERIVLRCYLLNSVITQYFTDARMYNVLCWLPSDGKLEHFITSGQSQSYLQQVMRLGIDRTFNNHQ